MTSTKCDEVVAVARDALALPVAQRDTAERVLTADVALLGVLSVEIDRCEHRLEQILADTPAGVLASLPSVGVVRASGYGAAIGDHTRFPNAPAAYSFAGLTPSSHDSAQKGPRAEATGPRIHFLRHTAVSTRIAHGASVKQVQVWAGDSSASDAIEAGPAYSLGEPKTQNPLP